MSPMKCPDCGAQRFYVKDPEDQFNLFEFDLMDGGEICFDEGNDPGQIKVSEETETYCDRCAWHDKFKTLR